MRPYSKLIKRLKRQNAQAQRELYEKFSPRYYALCYRYMGDKALAEDMMMEGFMKIFTNILQYDSFGSFEAWMHRIMVNQCLMEIRKSHNLNIHLNAKIQLESYETNALDELYEEDLLALVERLPMGCKTVFNLFIIEGYSHKEIAYQLGISEGTSKSQLNLAKKKLREAIYTHFKKEDHGR